MAYEEYRGFFHIGMVERNEHNAIIQHGTMTIVAKDALEEVDGWSEWCITEDTELGLKLFEAGYEAAYVPQSMGSGLMPDTLEAFMTQRYRWVYGAMQMLKRHAKRDFRRRLGAVLAAALPVPVRLAALDFRRAGHGGDPDGDCLDGADVGACPAMIDVPMPALSAAAMALFATKLLKTLLLYPPKVGSGFKGAFVASVAGLSLTHTVGKAVWTGLFTSGKPFLRTPKCADPASFTQVLRVVWQEAVLLTLLLMAMVSMGFRPRLPGPGRRHVDGDAGDPEPALSRHHGDGADFRPLQPHAGRAGAGRRQAAAGGLNSIVMPACGLLAAPCARYSRFGGNDGKPGNNRSLHYISASALEVCP